MKAQSNISFSVCLTTLCFALMIGTINAGAQDAASVERVITADYSNIKGNHDTFFRESVGAGRAAEGLRADWQYDLAVVHREAGFKYIRFHGLLDDEMGVYLEDKDGKPIYDFQYVDALYDAILDIGMRPFVEISFMPQALASGTDTVFWWEANITPPKDYDKWEDLIRSIVEHWTARYGEDEVKQWYFEVWNEPTTADFWTGTVIAQDEYFKLYDRTARAIKSVSPDYRVGGPASQQGDSEEGHSGQWITDIINHAKQKHVPLDFISTHAYAVAEGNPLFNDPNIPQPWYLSPSFGAIIENVKGARAQIDESVLSYLPLHYTEWSTTPSSRDPVHDQYISAPFILSKLKGSEGCADSMAYWTFTDIFEEEGVPPSPFHGGFGLLNLQGLRKPAFYAYQFLNRLGDLELISNDAESWVTRGRTGVQVLFWNYTFPKELAKTPEPDQIFFKEKLHADKLGQARVLISELPPGVYKKNIYQVGFQVNDVYTDYLDMEKPETLSLSEVRKLAEKNDGHPVETDCISIGAGQDFIQDVSLRENDVYLITLSSYGKTCIGVGMEGVLCVARGTDDRLYYRHADTWDGLGGTDNYFAPLQGGLFNADPICSRYGEDQVLCVTRGTDDQLYYSRFDGNDWVELGGTGNDFAPLKGGRFHADPSCTGYGDGEDQVLCVTRGTDDQLYYSRFDGNDWAELGGAGNDFAPLKGGLFNADPICSRYREDQVLCVTRGTDSVLYVSHFDGGDWSESQRLIGVYNE